jgi:hypothetical protein
VSRCVLPCTRSFSQPAAVRATGSVYPPKTHICFSMHMLARLLASTIGGTMLPGTTRSMVFSNRSCDMYTCAPWYVHVYVRTYTCTYHGTYVYMYHGTLVLRTDPVP